MWVSFDFMEKKQSQIEKNELILKKLGARLKEYRLKKGFKSAEAASNHYEINRVQYARYESGKNIEFLTLIELLNKMNVSVSEFFSEGFDN